MLKTKKFDPTMLDRVEHLVAHAVDQGVSVRDAFTFAIFCERYMEMVRERIQAHLSEGRDTREAEEVLRTLHNARAGGTRELALVWTDYKLSDRQRTGE